MAWSVAERMAAEPVKGNRETDSLVFVVDDDASLRQAIKSLLQSVGLQVEAFASAAELLKNRRLADHHTAACLILDVRLPGVSGLDFQAELSNADISIPIIFYHWARRYTDDRACHASWRSRISD